MPLEIDIRIDLEQAAGVAEGRSAVAAVGRGAMLAEFVGAVGVVGLECQCEACVAGLGRG